MDGNSANGMPILYGDLDLHIIEARRLPNMDLTSQRLRVCFTACVPSKPPSQEEEHPHQGGGGTHDRDSKVHHHHPNIITSDPYVTVSVPQATLARTRVVANSQNPKWDERFNLPIAHPLDFLEFRVKDNDAFGAQTIGTVKIPYDKLAPGLLISDWFDLAGPNGKPPKPGAAIHLEMKFTPAEESPLYKHGIAGDPAHKGVRGTYFPLRKGHSLTLYQDAHVTDDCKLPKVKLDDGMVYEQPKCWEDICYAISEAHHMIYIVGWSVFHKIKLIREPSKPLPRGGDLTLGELLKYKSEEGVRVLLLVWDDKTSQRNFFFKTAGVMQTHDEETRKFFKHSSVICVLSPRYASDTQAHGNNRKVTAFLGGLDMCDGRYDTPQHRLFHGLDSVFKDDVHQPTFPPGTKAPRQPWHDLHSRIDGPAAYDVLINFAQRWRKATRWREFKFLKKGMARWHDDAMIKIERISWILSPAISISKDGTFNVPEDDTKLYVSDVNHQETWNVQIFRSIDSGSVKGFPKYVDAAQAQSLFCSKKLVIDRSILRAYIQAIRSAQHFIYIENQYFLGSSYAWPSYKDAGADHQIPMELAMKIISKIRAGERFAVYVVVPMWPEGDPKTLTMQEILFWQSQTMQTMYQVIAQELKAMKLVDAHPQDYLNFYCLGKREEIPDALRESGNGDKASDSWKNQRFMIYVHAKGMIVDDEYVILGSANINQRSMAGTKDTEIAMGSYQPHHTWAKKHGHPHGQIYGYRMSLWAEHLGLEREVLDFEEPQTLECVQRVNKVAEDNWMRYTAENFSLLQGHLLKYPIKVEDDGTVGPLPGFETFPDVGGKIVGAHATTLPDILTT
ncbi:OLC1v1011138C1 [Oldenlandia corymbosa var. corymbosa]|uniref:Phospholipase D n=1 Tax=Oldenlandia corymbosa var. corymbosa TaxID=529605 RepID=A0AAV1DVC1_OLDCO|nr:OLC1v1011138C1 [Oldenlandia corymbosa var. corymbosa]